MAIGGCQALHVEAGTLEEYVVGLVMAAANGAILALVRAERIVADTTTLVREVAEDEEMLASMAARVGARELSQREWLAMRVPIEARLKENRAKLAQVQDDGRLPADLVTMDDVTWDALTFDQKRG